MKEFSPEAQDALHLYPPFSCAQEETLRALLPCCHQVLFAQGSLMFRKGDAPDRMYLLLSGMVEVWQERPAPDNSILLSRVEAGQCLGEIGFFDEMRRTVSARVREDVRALEFLPEARNIMLADPGMSRCVIRLMASRLRASNRLIDDRYGELERVNERMRQNYTETVLALSQALELRDRFTAGHSERVTAVSMIIGRSMGLSESELYALRLGAMLHDIGKIGIPDAVLHKPGQLDEAEWDLMKTHPELGRRMIERIDFLRPAVDVVYCHHEKWAGGGYPRNLSGEAIPLAARIFALADVFDALIAARPYKNPWSLDDVIREIHRSEGTHFDPLVVQHFQVCLPAIIDATERSRQGDPLVDIINEQL